MKTKLFLLLLLFISLNIYSQESNYDMNSEVIDLDGNVLHLNQKIDDVIKILGQPDDKEIYPFANRDKDEYDYVDFFYNDSLIIGFYKGFERVKKIVILNSSYKIKGTQIKTKVDKIEDVISLFGKNFFEYKDNDNDFLLYSYKYVLPDRYKDSHIDTGVVLFRFHKKNGVLELINISKNP